MPRQARLDVPGALHHIMVRRINKTAILGDDRHEDMGVKPTTYILQIDKNYPQQQITIESARQIWLRNSRWRMNKFPFIENDTYIIMPNHFHGTIATVGADT